MTLLFYECWDSSESCNKSLSVVNTVCFTHKLGRLIALTTSSQGVECLMEIDTHANTTGLGKHCLVIQDFDQPVDVLGWDSTLGTL